MTSVHCCSLVGLCIVLSLVTVDIKMFHFIDCSLFNVYLYDKRSIPPENKSFKMWYFSNRINFIRKEES